MTWFARFPLVAFLATLVACTPPFHVPGPPPTPASAIGRTLSRADALVDLDTLMHTLEDVHPDLYAVRSRDSVAAMRGRIAAALPDSLTRIDWWMRLAPMLATFGDGHTNLAMPAADIAREQSAGVLMFPPSVAVDDDRRLVVTALLGQNAGIRRGDRVLTINGHDADSLATAWMDEFSGERDAFRLADMTDQFRSLVTAHGIRAPFILTVADPDGATRTVTMPGVSHDSLAALLRRNRGVNATSRQGAPVSTSANFSYRVLERGVGYMDLRSLSGDLNQFETDATAMFRQVAADSDHTLIIDLRANGGGDSWLGDVVLRHVTETPYRSESRNDWKMSAEYRAWIKTWISPPLRWIRAWNLLPQGRAMFHGPDGTIVTTETRVTTPERAEPFFSGAVCVLTGPRTYSSAADFADAVKTYHLATLIGEETGGRPNTFGAVYWFLLPRSALLVSVASARFVRANGDTTDHRGVIPDIAVSPTPADRRAGRDVVLDRARRCPTIRS